MTEIDTPHSFDWANDAYAALNEKNNMDNRKHQTTNWPFSGSDSTAKLTFSVPPSLLSHAAIERYGQVTPPEEHSPAEPSHHRERESSIPVEQLRNETLWPEHHPTAKHMQASPPAEQQEPSPKRRRASRQASANRSQTVSAPPQQDSSDANPQPPKRKRGRPKSEPQLVEAFTADGFPFTVSLARQSHLEKNRVAAHKCRQRKKEYINGLEGRARDFSNKNKLLKENVALLREEVLGLKNEVLRHAGCGFWAVDEYLARCAGDLLGMEAPSTSTTSSSRQNSNHNTAMTSDQYQRQHIQTEDTMSFGSHESDDFGCLELLKDFDDDDVEELEKVT